MKHTLSSWITDLKNQLSFSSAVEFFVKRADFPVVVFDYDPDKAWLILRQSQLLPVDEKPVCFRLHESSRDFEPKQLYDPQQIPVFQAYIQKLFNEKKHQYFPLVFNKEVKSIFVYSSESDLTQNQFLILETCLKNLLWKEKWEKENSLDELTFCLNKKFFLKRLFIEVSRARRLKLPITLIILEIDQWATLRSNYSSYKTDTLIKSLASQLIRDSRSFDIFGSWPEGKLALILPHVSEREAGMKAEKIRWSVQSADFLKVFPKHNRLTLSLGLAEYPRVNRSADDLFRSTLKALKYAHTECGGNMTAVATPAVGFKPDFSVQTTSPIDDGLRDLT